MGGSRSHVPISTCRTVPIHVTHSTSQLLQTALYRVKMGDGTSGAHASSLVYLVSFVYTVFEGTLYLACNDKRAFFPSTDHRGYKHWSCQNVCDALSYCLDNIYVRFAIVNKLYRQIVGIPMGTNYAPLVADLFLFCYEIS